MSSFPKNTRQQFLYRLMCDHKKDQEPTKDDVLELAEGVEKVIKTVFYVAL